LRLCAGFKVGFETLLGKQLLGNFAQFVVEFTYKPGVNRLAIIPLLLDEPFL